MRTQLQSYLRRTDITGFGDDFCSREIFEGVGVVAYGYITGTPSAFLAVEFTVGCDQLFFQCGRHKQRLEGRARLQRVSGQTVAIDGRFGLAIIVGIEEGVLRPGEYLAALYVGYQNAAPSCPCRFHCGTDDIFGNELHLNINGERDIFTLRLFLEFYFLFFFKNTAGRDT